MKRWRGWVAVLLCLCCLQAGLWQAAGESAVVLTAEQLTAFSDAAWAGYRPVLWQETYPQDEYLDDALRGEPGAYAVMQRDGENVLCILARAQDGTWRVVMRASVLPPGPVGGDYTPSLIGYAVSHVSFYYDEGTQDGLQEGGQIMLQDGRYEVTDFYHRDAQGVYQSMRAESGLLALYWHGDIPTETMLLPLDAVDRDVASFDRQAAIAFLADMYALRNGPRYIPDSGRADTLPQAEVIAFVRGRAYDVYTGPGTAYARAGDEGRGNATVSTNDWIQVLGREGDWLLIQYNLGDYRNRFGYITASALPSGAQVSPLAFDGREAVAMGNIWITDDPLRNVSEFETLREGQDCTWLATIGDRWAYVEATGADGLPYRGFVLTEGVRLRADFSGTAVILAEPGSNGATAYASEEPSVSAVGIYRQGVQARVIQRGETLTRVRVGDEAAAWEGYIRTDALAFDSAPVDVPARIGRAALCGIDAFILVPVYATPDAGAETVANLHSTDALVILGQVGAWAHVAVAYRDTPQGFVRADLLMPLPEDTAYTQDVLHVRPGGAALRQTPDADGTMLLQFYEGMRVERIAQEGDWAFVTCWQPQDAYPFQGYMRADALTDGSTASMPIATVNVRMPGERGPYTYLLEQPSEHSAYRALASSGAKALVMGERGDWRYVRVGSSHGYIHASDLTETQARGGYETDLYLGAATALAAEGETEVRLLQFPHEDAAMIREVEPGSTLLLVADLGGWWQVDMPDWHGGGFLKTQSLQQQ